MNYQKFILGLLFILLIDNIYLQVNKKLYQPIIDPSEKINITAAVLSWVVIVTGIQLLVLSRDDLNRDNVFMYGAFLGFSMYALYNMTNFALYPSKWSIPITLVDILWGTILSGITSLIMYNYF
jgi:hypothetical protein